MRKLLDKVRSDGPAKYLVAFIVFQTFAAAFAAEVVGRLLDGKWSQIVWSLLGAVVLGAGALWAWARRGELGKNGTAIAVVVPRAGDHWRRLQAFKLARDYASRERYRYCYPLASPTVPRGETAAEPVSWVMALEAHGAMLSAIFDHDGGPDVDDSKVLLSLAVPLPMAFQLGSRWDDFTAKRADEVEVLGQERPGRDAPPLVVWKATPNAHPMAVRSASPKGTAVFLLQPSFDEQPLRTQFGDDFEVVGRPAILSAGDTLVEQTISELRALLSDVRFNAASPLNLILATTAPVAVALGWRLHDQTDRIRLWEFNKNRGVYYPVSF